MSPEVEAIVRACRGVLAFFYDEADVGVEDAGEAGAAFSGSGRVVVLGVEGNWRGSLVLSFDGDAIPRLAEKFMGMPFEPDMEDSLDEVLLELGNQIAARACREIEDLGIGRADLTPPSLLRSSGTIRLAWNRPRSAKVRVCVPEPLMEVAVGLSPGPRSVQDR